MTGPDAGAAPGGPRVAQVLVGADPGDAITNTAFEIDRLLPAGTGGGIFARYFSEQLAGRVRPLDALERRSSSERDVILLHVSIGEPEVAAWLEGRPERLVLVYHNISPAGSFERHDQRFARLLDEGRRTLPALLARAERVIADSQFNASELRELGAEAVEVVPLLSDPGRLAGVATDEGTDRHLETTVDGPVILFVGQLLPHKRPDWLLQAYHVLVTYLRPDAHLILAGASRLPGYTAALQEFVDRMNLDRCWLAGRVSENTLASMFRRADVFATASEHEGFCAPLLEAMSLGVPVVARDFAAIPETAGGAGLILSRDDGPAVMAEALAEVIGCPETRGRLTERGHERVRGAWELAQASMAGQIREIVGR